MFRLIRLILFPFLLALALADSNPPSGRSVYERSCAHCHGDNGEGWSEKNGPKLRQTDWVIGDPDRLIRITLSGLALRIPLNNGTHYGCMPGHANELQDVEIASVLTYLRSA